MPALATRHHDCVRRWSDTVGRKPLIVAGMLPQAAALAVLALSNGEVAVA